MQRSRRNKIDLRIQIEVFLEMQALRNWRLDRTANAT
jgi:hypothetical protein